MPTKEALSELIHDRAIVIWLLIMLFLCVGLVVSAVVGLHVSDVQLPIRYTDFGITNTYRDQWYYLLSFPLLALCVVVFHSLISVKLLAKSRQVALGFLVMTSAVLAFAIIIVVSVLNLVSVSL